MAKMLQLRWTRIETQNGIWFDSNRVILHGICGIHVEMKGQGNDITAMQSMTGDKYVSCFQDYFGDLWDKIIPHPGIGQTMKFRVNRLPDYAIIRGDVEDGGDVDPDNPEIPLNAFYGSEGEPFRGNNTELFLGKQPIN